MKDPTGDNTHPNDMTDFTFFHRYLIASRWCKDKDILDCACGYGYGTHLLKIFAKSVTGIDKDISAIDWAEKNLHGKFVCGDVLKSRSDFENKFDTIISIETFEHLKLKDSEQFLINLKKWVKPNGTVLITTPQRLYPEWKFRGDSHQYEYSIEEFVELIRKVFNTMPYIFSISEFPIGYSTRQVVSVANPNPREGHIMVAVVEGVKK